MEAYTCGMGLTRRFFSHLLRKLFHIPSDLVVDLWASDGERRSPRDFLFLHDV